MTAPPLDPVQNGDKLALLGHDLRAVLAEMRSELQMVNDLALPDTAREAIDRCRAAGEALSRLIDQSVLVCLGQAAPDAFGLSDVATDGLLNDLQRRWTGICAASGHRFAMIRAGKLPDVLHIDRTALERILGNLIGNAIAHTPRCQITLNVKVIDGDILMFSVEDEGPGFSPDHLVGLERSFEIPAQSRRPGGGFGLQSVKMLVTALGGQAQARNKSGGGAEVTVCLPLASPALPPDTDEPAVLPLPPVLTGIHLLIADDSAASRDLLALLARQVGADVTCVPDGAQALTALQSGPCPDVLILDAEMPGTNGLQVLTWLRAQAPPLNRLPVLVLTGHSAAAEVDQLEAAGASRVMTKPVLCPIELGRAVLQALDGDKAQTANTAQTSAAPAFDLSPLIRLCDMAGPTAAAELLIRLEEDLSRAQAGLAQAVLTRHLGDLHDHSHVLIALAGTVGASSLHDAAVRLNRLAISATANPQQAFAQATDLDAGLATLVRDVRNLAATRVHGLGAEPPQ